MVDFGPKRKNHKTIEKPMDFYVFWVQTNDGALQQNRRHRNKIVKNQLVFIVFSEIEAVKRLLVDRVFIDAKSNFSGQPGRGPALESDDSGNFTNVPMLDRHLKKNTNFAFRSRNHIKSGHSERCPTDVDSLKFVPALEPQQEFHFYHPERKL